MTDRSFRLEEIASALGAELRGDGQVLITGVATLKAAGPSEIAFLANPNYARYLEETSAAAVILAPDMADKCPTNVLLLDNPYLGYARLSHWFDRAPVPAQGVHPTAVIDPSATVANSACIGPHVVIEADAVIGERVVIGAGSVVGARSQVGEDTVVRPRATLAHDVTVGKRCHILSGAVIGSDGFGFAIEQGVWHRIAQLGGVVLGDDGEVGANTTIDRGALDNTTIGNGVKLDNLIQIGHNVCIGDTPRSLIMLINWVVMPMAARTKLRNRAAKIISMTIAVVRSVPSTASRNIFQFSARNDAARTSAATTPTDAASVGVAIPA